MSYSNGPKLITNGLVLCLDAGNRNSYNSGSNTWFDLSGRGSDAVLTNGPTFNTANFGTIVQDGVNDYIINSNNVFYTYDKEITVSSWLKFSAFKYILSQGVLNSDNMTTNVWLWHFENNGLVWFVNDAGTWRGLSYTSLTTNVWYNIVTVANASGLYVYVNNSLVVSSGAGISTQIRNSSNSRVATTDIRYATTGRVGHHGNFSQISIYNRALSAAEIQQNYNANKGRFGL
jgi:hypothetical protein